MILLLGATGYIGQAFSNELRSRGIPFEPLSRAVLDYTRFDRLFEHLRTMRPSFVINAAGYPGHPDIDDCEIHRAETIKANILLPQTIARACYLTKTRWGHVSSGALYSGAKIAGEQDGSQIELDLNSTRGRHILEMEPARLRGFGENDRPNFSFREPPCSFYSGSKALAEEALNWFDGLYIWRPGTVFGEYDHPRNFLSRIQKAGKLRDSINSLTRRGDFVRACVDLWERGAPFGTYHVVNPGALSTRTIVERLRQTLAPGLRFEFWKNDEEFYNQGGHTRRSNCILDARKLLSTGIEMPSASDALDHALDNWKTGTRILSPFNRVARSSSLQRDLA